MATSLASLRCIRDEGFRAKPYTDTTGNLTIGYGCNLSAGWSQWLAGQVCDFQLAEAEADIESYPWYAACDDVRKSVLVELCFNMGLGGLLGFVNMLAACTRQDWATAGAELRNSAWFGQVGTRGPVLVGLLTNGGPT